MKIRHIMILSAMMLMMTSCISERVERKEPSGKKYSETIADKTFKDIRVCAFFEITLHKSDKYSVDIEVSEELKDHLKAEVNDGELLLCLDDEYGECPQYTNLKARADIYLPSFGKIDLSGAASLETADTFRVDKAEFYLSGASEIDKFHMIAAGADVRASGSSSMDAEIYADSLLMRVSGASDIELKAIGSKVGKYCGLDITGASETDVMELPYENVKVNCSGASEISVCPTKKLRGRASGASGIQYRRTSKDLNIDVATSGASSLKEK